MFSGEQNRVMQTITIKLDLQIEGACSLTPVCALQTSTPQCTKRKAPIVGGGWGVGPVEMESVC